VVGAYLGVMCKGEPDFENVEQVRENRYFKQAMGLTHVPSCETIRQRIDLLGKEHKFEANHILLTEICQLLKSESAQITPCFKDYVPLDIDVSPHDNSNTKKEGVSRTYKGMNGYAPIYAYLGEEGYCVNVELREGKQHCQQGTPEFIKQTIMNAKKVTDKPLLVRLDSGNDSKDNIIAMQNQESSADFIIKRNPRRESLEEHWYQAQKTGVEIKEYVKGKATLKIREGKRIFIYEEQISRNEFSKDVRMVSFITERTSQANGQLLLFPEYELESYYTSLPSEIATPTEIQSLYRAHGTSEQFHSEIKTDLDLERLPSGKFATNAIVLTLGIVAYNLLRLIGQISLEEQDYPPTAHKVKRRRIRTVILNYMHIGIKFVRHARKRVLKINRFNAWLASFRRMYQSLC